MNQSERNLIETALALLLRAKTSIRFRAMGGRNGCYEELSDQIKLIAAAELGLVSMLWTTEDEPARP